MISLEAYFHLCLWTFIVETLISLPLILVSGLYGGHHPAYFLWIRFIFSTLKSIIYMFGNMGLYPRYCEWFAVEKLTRYSLWDKSGLWIFLIVLNGYFSFFFLNGYFSNGYTDNLQNSTASRHAKPKVIYCVAFKENVCWPLTLDSFVFFSKTAGFVSFSNSLLVKLKLLDLAFV